MLAAANKGEYLNEIDIDSIYIKNQDLSIYQDANELENQRLLLLAEKYAKYDKLNAGETPASYDLLSVSLRDRIKSEQRKILTYIDDDDD